MPVNVCMHRGPICEWAVVHKHEHTEPHLPKQTRQCVYASFSKPMPSKVYRNARKVCTPRSKSLCRQPKVCIPRSLRRQTNNGKCVCFESVYTSEPAPTNKQWKVCMLRSKNPWRRAKVCIPRSLRWQTNKGNCVCLVLKACADSGTCEAVNCCFDYNKNQCYKPLWSQFCWVDCSVRFFLKLNGRQKLFFRFFF